MTIGESYRECSAYPSALRRSISTHLVLYGDVEQMVTSRSMNHRRYSISKLPLDTPRVVAGEVRSKLS